MADENVANSDAPVAPVVVVNVVPPIEVAPVVPVAPVVVVPVVPVAETAPVASIEQPDSIALEAWKKLEKRVTDLCERIDHLVGVALDAGDIFEDALPPVVIEPAVAVDENASDAVNNGQSSVSPIDSDVRRERRHRFI